MATFTKIASVSVGSGGAATIDFGVIPSTYTDLCVKYSLRSSGATPNTLLAQINSLSTNYSSRWIIGEGAVGSASQSGVSAFTLGYTTNSTYTANTFQSGDFYIPNYTSSNQKSLSNDSVTENNTATAGEYALWLSAHLQTTTSAINQIVLISTSGNFVQYSTATLYGIKNS
jgi:hypothetical protein